MTRRALLLLAVAVAAIASVPVLLSDSRPTEDVRWASGPAELAGTLHLPDGDGPHPAAVFVQGFGDWTRGERLFRVHAERLAGKGLAILIYDKRGCGESTGDWRRASLAELAEDALGGLRLLRQHPRIDPERLGLFGTSQGGAIALIAASRSADVKFLATLSLSTRSPAEHDGFIVGATLRQKHYSEEEIARAVELHGQLLEVSRTGQGWEEARASVEAVRHEPWFRDAGLELHPKGSGRWSAYRDLPMDFDPLPLLRTLEIPLFAAQGEEDWLVPGRRAAEVLETVRSEHGRDVTVVLIPGAEHTLRVRSGWPVRRWTWPEDYWDALDAWLAAHVLP